MRNKSLILVLFFSALSLNFILSCSNNEKVSAFTQEADTFLLNADFKGVVLIGKGDKILYERCIGNCDKKDSQSPLLTGNTTFEAGSLTKQMTAAAIMLLEKQKKLSVEDNLSKYFPDFIYGNQITIKMLLNMRSGLTDYINSSEEFFPKSVARQIEIAQYRNRAVDENIVLKYLNSAPLLAPPDSTYFYCNTNYYLLAKIIEQVSQMPYEAFIQQNIFDKCKMDKSNLKFQKTDAKGYDFKGQYYSIPESLAFGCGNLNTSARDLLKWNRALTKGKVIPKSSFKKMINTETSYGFGLYRKDNMIFHGGITNVFNAYNAYYMDSKISVIVLSNYPISEINATIIAGKIYKIYQKSN